MKKYLLLTLLLLTTLILVSCINNATPEPVIDETSDTTTLAPAPESNAETTEPDTTVTALDTTVAEPNTSSIPVTEPDTSDAMTEPAEESPFDEEWIAQNAVIPDVIPEFEQGDMVILSTEDFYTHGIHFQSEPIYRSRYYDVESLLYYLVSVDEHKEFREKFLYPDWETGIQPNEMYLVTAIKYFKISREDCEKAVARWWANVVERKNDDGTERYEIPNLDIIYTFDNEIINNYYLRNQ